MSRKVLSAGIAIVGFSLVLGACSHKATPNKNAAVNAGITADTRQNPADQSATQPSSSWTRTLVANVSLSGSLEQTLRGQNINPSNVNAQLVQYTFTDGTQKTILEFGNGASTTLQAVSNIVFSLDAVEVDAELNLYQLTYEIDASNSVPVGTMTSQGSSGINPYVVNALCTQDDWGNDFSQDCSIVTTQNGIDLSVYPLQ